MTQPPLKVQLLVAGFVPGGRGGGPRPRGGRGAGRLWAAGHTQLYNGQVQFIIEQVKPVEVGEDELAALLPTTRRNIDEMFQEVRGILDTLKHPAMKALADGYLADEELLAGVR